MNSIDQASQSNGLQPNLNAEQALEGVLKLIRGHKTVSEFTPESLNQAFQTQVKFSDDGSGGYGFGEKISADWNYSIEVNNKVKDLQGKQWSKFSFGFNPNTPGAYPEISSVCTMNFDKFTKELESIGYKREHFYGEDKRWIYDEFNNASMRIHVYLEGSADVTASKTANACVKSIEIW